MYYPSFFNSIHRNVFMTFTISWKSKCYKNVMNNFKLKKKSEIYFEKANC